MFARRADNAYLVDVRLPENYVATPTGCSWPDSARQDQRLSNTACQIEWRLRHLMVARAAARKSSGHGRLHGTTKSSTGV